MALAPLESLALVNAAMRALGSASAPQLADAIGMTGRNQPGTVRKWMRREAAPSFEPTIQLLRAVGALNEERWAQVVRGDLAEPAEAAPDDAPAGSTPAGLPAEGEVRAEDALLVVLAELRALLPELRALTEARARPGGAARRGGGRT